MGHQDEGKKRKIGIREPFFDKDTQKSLAFYVENLGFIEDWTYLEHDEMIVAHVSRDGFELIRNKDLNKAGMGRVFISLYDERVDPLRKEMKENRVVMTSKNWGMAVSEIPDIVRNALFFSPPISEPDENLSLKRPPRKSNIARISGTNSIIPMH